MSMILVYTLIGLAFIAIAFSVANSFVSEKSASKRASWSKGKKILWIILTGTLSVISSAVISVATVLAPVVIFANVLKPQLEDVMPALYYDGAYLEYSTVYIDDYLADDLVNECTTAIEQFPMASYYYDRAYVYYRTGNYDLARDDLLNCIEVGGETWYYYYDLGVVNSYLLDYNDSIDAFEKALGFDDIPLTDRGAIQGALTMLESYYGNWVYSLLGN